MLIERLCRNILLTACVYKIITYHNMSSHINISAVNDLDDAQFESIFGNIIEFCTDAATQANKRRPFNNIQDLIAAFFDYLENLNTDGKLVILKLHPDLVSKNLAAQGELTQESAREQSSAGLNKLTLEQKNIINASNERYKAKFGFPFIICARENKVKSITGSLQNRYNNTPEEEINTGINEVKKICKLRILDIVQ